MMFDSKYNEVTILNVTYVSILLIYEVYIKDVIVFTILSGTCFEELSGGFKTILPSTSRLPMLV